MQFIKVGIASLTTKAMLFITYKFFYTCSNVIASILVMSNFTLLLKILGPILNDVFYTHICT